MAKAVLRERSREAYRRGYSSSQPEIRSPIAGALTVVSKRIAADLPKIGKGLATAKAAEVNAIVDLDPDIIAVVTLKRTFDITMRPVKQEHRKVHQSYQAVCVAIGRSLLDEAMAAAYKAQDPDGYQRLITSDSWKTKAPKKRHATISVHFSKKQHLTKPEAISRLKAGAAFHIGSWAFERLNAVTGWFEKGERSVKGHKSKLTTVRPCPELVEKVDELRALAEAVAWQSWPMVCPPEDWTPTTPGGYLTANRRKSLQELVSRENRQSSALIAGSRKQRLAGTAALEALNRQQQIPYRINQTVLEVARELQEMRRSVGKFQAAEPTPVPPYSGDSPEELKTWKRLARDIHDQNALLVTQNYPTSQSIYLAEKFRDETFWLPWNFDFRGRMYPMTWPISPQSTDFGKSLLLFAEEGPVNEYWLAFHVATTYGLGKSPMAERQAWVGENRDLIYRVSDDPIGNLVDWESADEPWQFLAACIEYTECLRDGRSTSGLPIGVDATCSGIQHLSALTRDASAASMTNVLPTTKPADAYQVVADKVVELLPACAPWMNRKVVKRVVMTLPYGLTRHSARAYLREALEGLKVETDIPLSELTRVVFCEAIPQVLPGPVRAMAALKDMCRQCLAAGRSIAWVSPSGFPVVQIVNRSQSLRVDTHLHGSARPKSFDVAYETDQPHNSRHISSIAPNYIHSLDAALLHLTFQREGRPFTLIHDCVLMRSCDMDYIQLRLREKFVSMYQQPLLEHLASALGVPMPEGVIQGTFDPADAFASPYLFC